MKIYNVLKEILKEQEEEEPKNGFHYEYFHDGQLMSKIHYFDGEKDGFAEYYTYPENDVSRSGFYKDDKKIGKWRIYNPINPDQIEFMVYKNGALFQAEYYDSTLNHLNRKVVYKHGDAYRNGEIHVDRMYKYNEDGKISMVEIPDLKKRIKYVYHNGVLIQKQSYNSETNQKEGILKTYNDNGKIQSKTNYSNGERNGKEYIYVDGKLHQIITYKNNLAHGINKVYLKGNLYKVLTWEDNRINGPFSSYYDNKLTDKGFYKDGKKDGLALSYINGKLYDKSMWKDGEKNGPYTSYYLSGEISEEGNYKNDEKDGEVISYHQNKPFKKIIYNNGVIVSETYIYENL